jgi:hypothetical protein
MKKLSGRFVLAVSIMLISFISSGCGGGKFLKTQDVQSNETINGLYTLILYHDGSNEGLKTIAFLQAQGEGYSLVPYAPDYEYAVMRNIGGKEALQKAFAWIRDNPLYKEYEIRKILSPTGKTIGYEVRPLYDPLAHGISNVMTVSYLLGDKGIVQMHIDLLEKVINDYVGD